MSTFTFGFTMGAFTMFTLCVGGLVALAVCAFVAGRVMRGYEPMPLEKVSREDFVGTWFLASVETDDGVIYPGTDAFTLNTDGTANVTDYNRAKYDMWTPGLSTLDEASAFKATWKLTSDFPARENAVLEFRGGGRIFEIFVSDEYGDIVLKKYLGDPDGKQFICWRKRPKQETEK